jgi:hypothetical protein
VTAPWAPRADGSTILVIDLPGVQSVGLAQTLLHAGYRPIPLFNAVPGPSGVGGGEQGDVARTVVDVYPIIDALELATARVREQLEHLPTTAPPAFLLDAARRLGNPPRPGDFDNRSVSLPTDFPSASFLQSRGVTHALVVLEAYGRTITGHQPATDLAHTLVRWQAAGITILSCAVDEHWVSSRPRSVEVARPTWFGAIWHNALSMIGLRRNPLGGFGGTLPVPSAG